MSSTDRSFPAWLAPYKNKWLSAGNIGQLMRFEGQAFVAWFDGVKPRLRRVQERYHGDKVRTLYLVKHVWACARAHGLSLVPGRRTSPTRSLEDERDQLREQNAHLAYALQDVRSQLARCSDRSHEANLLRALLTSMLRVSEPRPAPGVYFLLSAEGEVTYVGQSQNVLMRMSGHSRKVFHAVRMIEVEDKGERDKLEMRLIKAFHPRDNINGKIAGGGFR